MVAAVVVAVVYVFYRLMERRGWKPRLAPRWRLLYVYALLGALMHIAQDFTNNYGVRPLAPWNPRWHSWDIVSLIDPIMLAALILGVVIPAILTLIKEEVGAGKPQFRGRGGAVFALLCMVVVILVRDVEHRRALVALNSMTYREEDPLRVSAYPYALNPFLWSGVVETRDFFEVVPVDSLSGQVDPQNQAKVHFKPQETPVTLAAKKSRLGRFYLDWARYPLLATERLPENAGYMVQFQDLRFADARDSARMAPPLTGYVELDPQLRVTDEYMGRPAAERRGR
jgi:inner membrane protein